MVAALNTMVALLQPPPADCVAMFSHRGLKSLSSGPCGAECERATDECDVPVPQFEQVLHRLRDAPRVVDTYRTGLPDTGYCIHEDRGYLSLAEGPDQSLLHLRGHDGH